LQEIPHLRVGAARLALFILFLTGLSCAHFERPEFDGPSEFTPAGEYMNSPEVRSQQDHLPMARGPFRLQWPVAKPVLNRGFRVGHSRRDHLGIDLKGKKNDYIYAAHDGYVVYAGQKFRGYGKMIIIEYDGNWATLYGHMTKFKVKTGQEVHAGELIGLMGRTGRATGVHLHFEVLKNKEPVDPMPLLGDPPPH
jgi:murein DD-endopeptidase MepM/ murein hydrolase activator NlpD